MPASARGRSPSGRNGWGSISPALSASRSPTSTEITPRESARLARQLKIPVLAAVGTWDRLRPRMPKVDFVPLRLMHSIEHRGFRVEACPTSHDAAQLVALAVTTATGYRVAVAYDLGRPTTAVRLLLRNAHAIVLEANYDDVLLRTSGYPRRSRPGSPDPGDISPTGPRRSCWEMCCMRGWSW